MTKWLNSIESVLADLRQGRMVIVVDDEDRENEGDLIMAGEWATPDAINFMARFGRGLICAPTTSEPSSLGPVAPVPDTPEGELPPGAIPLRR